MTLDVTVSDPDGSTVDVTLYGREALEPFSIIVLPDTQFYAQLYPEIFDAQVQWIADNKDAKNIQFVVHAGDIVEFWDSTLEWQRTDASMTPLDVAGIQYSVVAGAHEHEGLTTTGSTSFYNQYFGPGRFAGYSWYGGTYNGNDNNYQLVTINGEDYIFLSLDWCPSADEVVWADGILTTYDARKQILTTHGYMDDTTGNRDDIIACGSTQYIWDDLVTLHANLQIVLNSHENDLGGDGEATRIDPNNAGNLVYQMLANYQGYPNGGDGWLRILDFDPANNKVHVRTYSPWLDQSFTDPTGHFSFDYELAGKFQVIGTVTDAASGTAVTFDWTTLNPSTEYEWYVDVTDIDGNVTEGDKWRFTTAP